ncbi:small peptidoglycan-associated lipoprotein [Cytobacillus sp. FJAT-53684]|uniref:Small peptidoglycan-associated lipoprotein n=1 Tax=Cytobacillus mangrovibacter TaxID=3299024 RepID=A0ABW6JX86_9BACI
MKGFPILMIASLFFIISSCHHIESKEELNIDQTIKQIIFFTNNQAYEQEAAYYDAIIELKKEFPTEIKNMKIITAANAKKYYGTFKINNCPAILINYKDKIIVKVEGEASTEQIVAPFYTALKEEL